MRRRTLLTGGLTAALGAAAMAGTRRLRAEAHTVRLLRPVDLSALPLLVMEHDRLIERTAEAMGLGRLTVVWTAPGKAAPIEALAAGQADFAAVELVPFLVAATAEPAGGTTTIRGIGALLQRPYVLVTRNRAVRTIRDFGPADRIAVPALRFSGPAVMLDMAAAREWGVEEHEKLARLAVAMPDDSAAAALLAGTGGITAHFSRMPHVDRELADPAISRVIDSFDIAGTHSAAVLATTMRLRDANPELCKAVLSALQQAGEFIGRSPGAAAEIFAGMAPDEDIPPEDLADMIGDPDLVHEAAPAGVMRIAAFMHRTGRLKRAPTGWRELFLPEARDLAGS
jgi:NitT/TauT family transport system substrate-binding protein